MFICIIYPYLVFIRFYVHYYRATLARVLAVDVRLSVCLSQGGVLLKWPNVGSRKQRHTIAQGVFSDADNIDKTQTRSPQQRRQMQTGFVKMQMVR